MGEKIHGDPNDTHGKYHIKAPFLHDETEKDGQVANSNGLVGDGDCCPKPAPWPRFVGEVSP